MINDNVTKIIGYILLAPGLISVLLFFIQLFAGGERLESQRGFMFSIWTGSVDFNGDHGGGGGFTSALPFYFGLMALAGAYLIKDRK